MANTDLHLGIGLDTTDFAAFARALRRAAPTIAADLRLRLRAAGQIVADEAKSIAAQASTTIPASIKVRAAGATVTVVAGGTGVPLAGLFELGNAGGGSGSTFRHPVFGNMNVWVDQPMHPFLAPAVERTAEVAEQAAVEALDHAIDIAVRR